MREFALPGTRPRYVPDRVCSARHYRLQLELDVPGHRVSGTATLRLAPLVDGDRWLRLDAVELEVSEVRRDGRALEFRADGSSLRIALDGLVVDQELELEIDYAAQPRRGLYFIGPDHGYPDKPVQVWSQGQDEDSRHWFPCLDVPSEKATSEVIVTVPAAWTTLSNGRRIADRSDGDRRTQHWRFDQPHSCYLVTLVAGELVERTERAGDVELVYLCEPGREADLRRTVGRTPAILEHFSRTFGVPYPYERYAQVFVADFIFGGMENTTATTMTDTALYDERAAIDFDADRLVAHELAHQWFGDLLTCRTWGEGWLNEGFATYSEYVWRQQAEDRDEADLELEGWAESYFAEDGDRYRRVIATNVYDEPIDIFDHHLYEKGGRVLHMLRQEVGDDGFWRGVKRYLEEHRDGSVETSDLARAMADATGRSLDWFFDQWVRRGAGHPELEVDYGWDGERRLAVFGVRQVQKLEGPTPIFRLPIAVALTVGGVTTRHTFTATEAQHTFVVPCGSEPSLAVFDPGKTLLAALKTEKPSSLWEAELEGAALGLDRRDAARQLGRLGGARATAALVAALGGDPFWGVRAACADALAATRTIGARDALVAALRREAHPRARRAVARALGAFRHDEVAAAALVPIVESGDPSYFVEAEACLSLGRTRSPLAFELLVAAASRPSFTDVIRQFVWRGLAELRDERALPLLFDGARYGRNSHGRRAALLALADLARGRRDRVAHDVRERAEELLRDPDFRIQVAAIEALFQLGEPAAIAALDEVVVHGQDGRLRRRAREVIRDLGDRAAPGEHLAALRDEVERLRSDGARLRERLDKLESTVDPDARPPTKAATRAAKTKAKARPPKKPAPRRRR